MYNEEGMGSTKIAMILNEHGIKSAVNGQWAHFTVSRVLKNVKYIGKIMYCNEIYDGKHEPLISEETFNLAQDNRKDRTWKVYRGSNYNKFLFNSIIRCGICKKTMKIHCNTATKTRPNLSTVYYYICNHHAHTDASHRCPHKKHYRAEDIDSIIVEEIKLILKGKKTANIKENSPVIDILTSQRNKAVNELERVKRAYIAGAFTVEEYKEEKMKLEEQIRIIDINRKNTTDKGKSKRFRAKAATVWEEFEQAETIELKKMCLKKIIDVIYITPETITINCLL